MGGAISASGRIFLSTGYTLYALKPLHPLLAVVLRHISAKNFQNVCIIVPFPGLLLIDVPKA
jgi:hypothetical protein